VFPGALCNMAIVAGLRRSPRRFRHSAPPLRRDHIGSIDRITDVAGQVVEDLSCDAFGKRRSADWTAASGSRSSELDRGYTGHVQLDHLGLIHMGGRVYDPQLGRFTSADPVEQFPESMQGLNRYSYVQNNPLTFVDPSGFGLKRFVKALGRTAKNVAANVFRNPSTLAQPALHVRAYVMSAGATWSSLLGFISEIGWTVTLGTAEGLVFRGNSPLWLQYFPPFNAISVRLQAVARLPQIFEQLKQRAAGTIRDGSEGAEGGPVESAEVGFDLGGTLQQASATVEGSYPGMDGASGEARTARCNDPLKPAFCCAPGEDRGGAAGRGRRSVGIRPDGQSQIISPNRKMSRNISPACTSKRMGSGTSRGGRSGNPLPLCSALRAC